MIALMERLSFSLPEDLAGRIRDAAREDGTSLSAWLTQAAETQRLLRNARSAIQAWEQANEPITDEEMACAERAWRGDAGHLRLDRR